MNGACTGWRAGRSRGWRVREAGAGLRGWGRAVGGDAQWVATRSEPVYPGASRKK